MIRRLASRFSGLSKSRMCSLLKVSRALLYRPASERPERAAFFAMLRDEIETIILYFNGYGYRRVAHDLRRRGFKVGFKTVAKVMRENSLQVHLKKRWVPTTDSDHGLKVYPNLAKKFVPQAPGELWVSDITYIRLFRGFAFLAVVLDAFTRKAVGWELSSNLETGLCLRALRKALESRPPKPGFIHHSDRGVQYASKAYSEAVLEAGGRLSMSAKGCPRDNAKAESFFKTLKTEEVHLQEYESMLELEASLERYIDRIYNCERLHSSLGYLPPAEFEIQFLAGQSTA